MKFKDNFLIIFFLCFIYLPLFCMVFNIQDGLYNTEKRNLENFPKFKSGQFSDDFLKYYEDNFGLRYSFMRLASNLKIKLFKTYPKNIDLKVLKGKDGWLFYKLGNEIEDFQGKVPLSNAALNRILARHKEIADYLSNSGKKLYVLIPPDKSTIYSEFLPDGIVSGKKSDKTRISQLLGLNSEFIYPKNLLLKNKDKGLLYFKTDTHWTYFGAYFGYLSVMENLKNDFDIKEKPLSSFKKEEYTNKTPDLADIINIGEKSFEKSIKFSCNNDARKIDKKVLLFGDSFLEYLKPYFECTFYEVRFINQPAFNKEIVENFNPDIVIMEIVQRNVRHLFD